MTAAPSRKIRRHGTFYVLEDPPPPTRRRWYCHQGGSEAPGFEDVDEAVAWGLTRARTVVVRTLGMVFYWAGERPADRPSDGAEMRPWPPAGPDRQQIDVDYRAAWTAADAEDAAYAAYERQRDEWVRGNAPELVGLGPVHQCLLVPPGPPQSGVAFEELDLEGRICGALTQNPRNHAFGSAEAVITAVIGLESDDPWVAAVCRALNRERSWDTGRRPRLVVERGQGEMFHLTATENRASITQHGPDWRRMGAASGIAGSLEPELPAVFLCEDRDGIRFFTMMARTSTDIWGVRVDELWTESGPDGWIIIPEPVPPNRLRLVETDQPVTRHR